MKWRIVGFNHPGDEHSLIYKQNLSDEKLIEAIRLGIVRECNLFSIRGFEDEYRTQFKRVEEPKIGDSL
jgi:hypothetical protein